MLYPTELRDRRDYFTSGGHNDLNFCNQMSRQTYKHAYDTAKADLLRLTEKRRKLDSEIRKLHDSVKSLGELCGIDPDEVNRIPPR
jgi:hypothetical protein